MSTRDRLRQPFITELECVSINGSSSRNHSSVFRSAACYPLDSAAMSPSLLLKVRVEKKGNFLEFTGVLNETLFDLVSSLSDLRVNEFKITLDQSTVTMTA